MSSTATSRRRSKKKDAEETKSAAETSVTKSAKRKDSDDSGGASDASDAMSLATDINDLSRMIRATFYDVINSLPYIEDFKRQRFDADEDEIMSIEVGTEPPTPPTATPHRAARRKRKSNRRRFHGPIPLDVIEFADKYVAVAELPGFSKAQVTVRVSDDKQYLIIHAHHPDDVISYLRTATYIHRDDGPILQARTRTLRLPANVDADRIDAAMDNGVLRITIPKKLTSKPASREIQIN